jgi:molybdopterin synthase sulfur carrier subunit
MSVAFYATLRRIVGARSIDVGDVTGLTLRELVDVVIRLHPGLAEELLDEAGEVSRRIHVVVDGRSAVWLPERFATRVAPGMTVAFFPAVAGG